MSASKHADFRALHSPGNPFILANAWDVGSAKMLVALGAKAIATSSAAYAFTLGRPDGGTVSRDESLAHAETLLAAVDVPISGDFENGFGDDPDTCAETIRLAAEIGLSGISIEDTTIPDGGAYDRAFAAERIKAASAAARALPHDFVLVARADGVLNGTYDMAEALARVCAFDEAGADCLYVPGPPNVAALAEVCGITKKPVNALAIRELTNLSQADFAALGVARISLGSALARVTHKAIYDAGNAMFRDGDFTALAQGISADIIDELLG